MHQKQNLFLNYWNQVGQTTVTLLSQLRVLATPHRLQTHKKT